MATVAWDAVDFLTFYPQFGNCNSPMYVSTDTLEAYFQTACGIVDNSENSIIPYDPQSGIFVRKIVLYALVCHIAMLNFWAANGQNGAVASASEGSVSASFQAALYKQGGDLAAYLRQTPCGQNAWMLMSRYIAGGRLYTVKHCHPWG